MNYKQMESITFLNHLRLQLYINGSFVHLQTNNTGFDNDRKRSVIEEGLCFKCVIMTERPNWLQL